MGKVCPESMEPSLAEPMSLESAEAARKVQPPRQQRIVPFISIGIYNLEHRLWKISLGRVPGLRIWITFKSSPWAQIWRSR